MKKINQSELNKIIESNLYVLVYFFTKWCGPCKQLSPQLEEIEDLYKDVKFVKIDIEENTELSQDFDITSVPTVTIIKDNEILSLIAGPSIYDILQLLQKR